LAADHLPGLAEALGKMMQTIGDDWRALGLAVDFSNLYYPGERGDIELELQARGWEVVGTSTAARSVSVADPNVPTEQLCTACKLRVW
jgi:hypothetical protein